MCIEDGRWWTEWYVGGYTSYSSLSDLFSARSPISTMSLVFPFNLAIDKTTYLS